MKLADFLEWSLNKEWGFGFDFLPTLQFRVCLYLMEVSTKCYKSSVAK